MSSCGMYYGAEWEAVVHVLGLACAHTLSPSVPVKFKQDIRTSSPYFARAGVMQHEPSSVHEDHSRLSRNHTFSSSPQGRHLHP